MGSKNNRSFYSIAVALLVGACANVTRDDQAGPDSGIPRAWQCDDADARLACTTALAAKSDESAAYACEPDNEGTDGSCPPASVFDDFDVDQERLVGPWACLMTGSHQRQCVIETTEASPQGGDPSAGDGPGDGGSTPGGTPEGDIPDDCVPDSWEPYFCNLATSKYQKHGVDITFPCDIFDANAPFSSTLPGVPVGGGDSTLPSCHDGEWEMREQSWFDAVGEGCQQLDNAILSMCQQAANYAPAIGACEPTGTW